MRLPKEVKQALEATGASYEIRKGSRHYKIVVGGRMVAIWPYGKATSASMRATKNIVAQIRRAA